MKKSSSRALRTLGNYLNPVSDMAATFTSSSEEPDLYGYNTMSREELMEQRSSYRRLYYDSNIGSANREISNGRMKAIDSKLRKLNSANALQTSEIKQMNLQEKSQPTAPTEPLHKESDIVYLKPGWTKPCEHYPSIGSSYEIDCKVLSHVTVKYVHYYTLVSGKGARIEDLDEVWLVKPDEKYKHLNSSFKILIEDTEIAAKDTVFLLSNGYYSNERLGIHIEKTKLETELKHLFK